MHWQSPRFFSWFAGNTSMPGILAEMLIGGLNMIGAALARACLCPLRA